MTEELIKKLFDGYEKMKENPVIVDGKYLINVEGKIYRVVVEAGRITEAILEEE